MSVNPRESRDTLSPLVQELLHAIGQPLTSLQMCVLLRDRPSLEHTGSQSLLHDMADQVTLLSRLFETLRQVLETQPALPSVTERDLEYLLLDILPEWTEAALQRDITVNIAGLQTPPPRRRGRPHRGSIETCLQEIFAASLESTPDRGSLTVTLALQAGAPCQLQILGGNRLSATSFSGRFALRTAKTLLDSDQQEFTYSLNPFQANLVLAAQLTPEAVVLHPSSSPGEARAGFSE